MKYNTNYRIIKHQSIDINHNKNISALIQYLIKNASLLMFLLYLYKIS
jgi:hypothetical protein